MPRAPVRLGSPRPGPDRSSDQGPDHTPGTDRTATGPGEAVTVRAEGTFRGRIPSFAEVRALTEAFGAALGADDSATARVVLVLEELFTNTVTHGYPGGSEGPVWVALASRGEAIEVTYEDAAPAFNPLTDAPAPLGQPLADEARPAGGLGLALVRGLSVSIDYARVGDRNRVTLTVSTASPPPSSRATAP
jgi:serine/threonine-protein kinase RsbW